MNEIEWIVEIQDFPDYFISTRGRIFSEKYGVMKEMKPSKDSNGYLQVKLYKERKKHYKRIHRLVGKTFLERVEGKNEIDHDNRIRDDNRLDNLNWVSRRENMINKGIGNRNKSGVIGVCFRKDCKRWVGYIQVEKNKMKRKFFKTKDEAIKWRLEMEQKYYK